MHANVQMGIYWTIMEPDIRTSKSIEGVHVLVLVLAVSLAVAGYALWHLYNLFHAQQASIAEVRSDLASTTSALSDELYILEHALHEVTSSNVSLADALASERDRVEDLRSQVGDFEDSVQTLEKLANTDPELLRKYSKVYFLNEHYSPASLKEIDAKYLLENGHDVSILSDVWPHLKDLLNDAEDDDVELFVLSGYRSFAEQNTLKSQYRITYGAGTANSFSADQGYSEHQLGTTVDFTTKAIGPSLTGFQNTAAYTWLQKNAYKYGFVLSYPENNAYYVFEPWHWRFVGRDLARYLNRQKVSFYDLDQRKIDSYLVDIFD